MPTPMIGSKNPRLVLYVPHKPNSFDELTERPNIQTLIANNTNHWRKIATLLAKICSPDLENWRQFRDSRLLESSAISINPTLCNLESRPWHWIGGKDNQRRFSYLQHNALPLESCENVAVDRRKQLLFTPYPDYRQLDNAVIIEIRRALETGGFYSGT
ncbi:hypothetical protein [Microbulbifer sp. SH-1]|uniref:DUF6942 family protein n=1 Tax=Microbulbifer sp. SH-1 TaxID=2681547 RepID=UPI00197C59EF|nr:hypothetical protein [Microbulbifer sp. SH-1]